MAFNTEDWFWSYLSGESWAGNYCESKRIPALGGGGGDRGTGLGNGIESPIHFSVSSPFSKTGFRIPTVNLHCGYLGRLLSAWFLNNSDLFNGRPSHIKQTHIFRDLAKCGLCSWGFRPWADAEYVSPNHWISPCLYPICKRQILIFPSPTANTCIFRLQTYSITMVSLSVSVTDKVPIYGGTGRCHQHKNSKMGSSECCMAFFNIGKTQ